MLALITLMPQALADDFQPRQGVILHVENDTRGLLGPGTDEYYTGGFKFDYWWEFNPQPSADNATFTRPLMIELYETALGYPAERGYYIFELGANGYTPRDITVTEVQEDDRPYSCWEYITVGSTAQARDHNDSGKAIAREVGTRLSVGFLGAPTHCEEGQTAIHSLSFIDAPIPEGWDNQLSDAFGINAQGYVRHRIPIVELEQKPWSLLDALPYVETAFGNVRTYVRGGSYLRLGRINNLLHGARNIDSLVLTQVTDTPDWELYGFARVQGAANLNNSMISGMPGSDSVHTLPARLLVPEGELGVYARVGGFYANWSRVIRGREIELESDVVHQFATIQVGYSWKKKKLFSAP